jgi:hypothetical protein
MVEGVESTSRSLHGGWEKFFSCFLFFLSSLHFCAPLSFFVPSVTVIIFLRAGSRPFYTSIFFNY